MNGIRNGNAQNLEKPYPGCLGRMVNLFDLGTGVAGNRLLADKPHHEGYVMSRSRLDVSRMSPIGDESEDEVIISQLRTPSNRKSDGTPIKTLIAQEMLKEVESNHNSPSLVAKLMGLDSLPCQQHDSGERRSHSRGYSLTHSDIPLAGWQEEHCVLEPDEYKDVYDIRHQLPKKNKIKDKSPQKGKINDKKMDLVRQKFVEVKRLATDEKLRKSKQFQVALEVLSSNGDLLLKLFQEPNSLISQHLHNLQSITPPTETKRITVLKPSKMVYHDTENEKQMKQTSHGSQVNGFSRDLDDHQTEPTRIVVLKPSCRRTHDVLPVSSSRASSSVQTLHDEFCIGLDDDEKVRMFENLSRHRRDETLLPSVFSNGYIGDESSFNQSEIEYEAGNLGDSEVISPVSRHSWDYVNRYDRPYSCSFSRASYSPESSVCREAKKRLSERWALIACNGSSQEQRHMRKNSSTLGEMLALSDAKSSKEDGSNKGQESSELNTDENADNSPRNFLRSKSVPISSTSYGARLNVEVPDPGVIKTDVPKELTKSRSAKSSFKGRVSSLFFSRNKKSTNGKASQCNDEPQSDEMPAHSSGKNGGDRSQCNNDPVAEEESCKSFSPDSIFGWLNQRIIPSKAGNLGENPNQPSPFSVLDLPFEEDYHATPSISDNVKSAQSGVEFPVHPIQSNLIDKSPLIGTIARTLSWDDACVGPPTPDHVQSSARDEGQEWFSFIQTLLSVAGFTNETNTNSFTRWHSSESPLDPSLREKYIDLNNDKEIIGQEGRRRQQRSTQKLVFDCVNAALVDLAGQRSGMGCGVENGEPLVVSVDQVWDLVKEWLSGEASSGGGDGDSLVVEVVEVVVRKEVVGKGWVGELREEVSNFGEEIGGKLLEELVEEAVVVLTGRVS